MPLIYGVDSDQALTPLLVRDALVRCFALAHCQDVAMETKDQEVIERYCHDSVVKAFSDSGGNFEHPDKQSILAAMSELVKLSSQFRDQEVIRGHYQEIMTLVSKL